MTSRAHWFAASDKKDREAGVFGSFESAAETEQSAPRQSHARRLFFDVYDSKGTPIAKEPLKRIGVRQEDWQAKGAPCRDSFTDTESFKSTPQGGGRLASEWVADFPQIQWPAWSTRIAVAAVDLGIVETCFLNAGLEIVWDQE